MKKLFWILCGISAILGGIVFILYKNNRGGKEEIVSIFKEKEDDDVEEVNKENKVEKVEESFKVYVDIKGMVVNPGVYEVDDTYRINDVINIAGGLLDGADTSLINLAKIVHDEMTIIIYSNEEIKEKYKEEVCVCDCPLITNDACIGNDGEDENVLVNINTADINELMKITGIGEAKAKEIIEYREENGNFKNVEEIKNVAGIGEILFEKIKEYITV